MEELLPELTTASVAALVRNADRLGLTWDLRLATVTQPATSTDPRIFAVCDGDTEPLVMTPLIGGYFPTGSRIWTLRIPPGGNYIIGATDLTDVLPSGDNTIASGDSGTTTSSTFAAFPGSPEVSITKRYPLGKSMLLFTVMGSTRAVGGAGSSIAFGTDVEGTEFNLSFFAFSTLATRFVSGGQLQIDANLGLATFPLLWRRPGGTSTITVDADDWTSFSVLEVPID